jgi:hypothetical protein
VSRALLVAFKFKKASSFRPERSAVEKSAFQALPPKCFPQRKALAAILFAAALSLTPTQAHPQGCTQCLDNTAATPPKTQTAYRRAIILLTLTATGLFAATLVIFKRHR